LQIARVDGQVPWLAAPVVANGYDTILNLGDLPGEPVLRLLVQARRNPRAVAKTILTCC
jgi:hypothetical protein